MNDISAASLSALFPSDDPVRALADAITVTMCEKIPALKGMNLQQALGEHYEAHREEIFGDDNDEASKFGASVVTDLQARHLKNANVSQASIDAFREELYKELSGRIKIPGDFGQLGLYLRDEYETRPEWFKSMIEKLASEKNFDLYSLMPYRGKLAFKIHDDGQLFWGQSSYGPVSRFERVKYYPGQPQSPHTYIEDTSALRATVLPQLYTLDTGETFTREFHPAKRGPLSEMMNERMAYWRKKISESPNPEDREAYAKWLASYESIKLKMTAKGIDLTSIDQCVSMVSVSTGQKATDFLISVEGETDDDADLNTVAPFFPMTGVRNFKYRFLEQEDGNFRLVSMPFQLVQVTQNVQFGIADENIRADAGDYIALTGESRYVIKQKDAHRIFAMQPDVKGTAAIGQSLRDMGNTLPKYQLTV